MTGLLVPPADPAALAEAVLEVWNDPYRRDRMGRAGGRRAQEHFDVRRMVAEYEALYCGGAWSDGLTDGGLEAAGAKPRRVETPMA